MLKRILILIFVLIIQMNLFSQTVTVEWDSLRQRIDGFGACDGWFSDEIMQHPNKDEMLDLLFKREGGAGLSILRHHITPYANLWLDSQVDLVSGDLDFGTRPFNSVRFLDIDIPDSSVIDSAFIQFIAKDDLSSYCELKITGELSEDPQTFVDTTANISGRIQTDSSINWIVPVWKNNKKGSKQKTPDLKGILQEVMDQEGWLSGHSFVFIFGNMTGKRSARTYDNGADLAPELIVYYDSTQTLVRKVSASSDDAEEDGISYLTYGAQVTQEAMARGCELVWAAEWSPPPEWKTNGQDNNGGYLKPEHYQDYADWLESYRAEMELRSGYPLYGISPQNEPGIKSWESCQWKANDFRDFIKNNLGPTLDPSCKIICPEETNWNNVDNFYNTTHNDAEARGYVDIVAGHVYGGDPNVSYNHFGKPVWETEWSYDTSKEDLTISNGIRWAHNFWKLLVNAEVTACHHWWMINLKDDGRQQGLISAAPFMEGVTIPKRLWTIGNYSKFIRPGWHRILATKYPELQVYTAAFRDTVSNEFAVVVINETSTPHKIQFDFVGFDCDSLVPHRTSSTEDLVELPAIAVYADSSIKLAGRSVTTFIGKGTCSETSVEAESNRINVPVQFDLKSNYPNPFNPSTTIEYSLKSSGDVTVEIFDLSGRHVKTLVNTRQTAGAHHIQWNATNEAGLQVSSGVYVYQLRIQSEKEQFTRQYKMLYLK